MTVEVNSAPATGISTCPGCGSGVLRDVVSLGDQPVLCNQLWPSAAEARAAPTVGIDLVCCEDCTLLSNRSFRPDTIAYSPGYENALHFSAHFRAFAEELGADLVARHALAGKQIVEIGCGDGYFLDLMVRNGASQATGFDPSMAGRPSEFSGSKDVRIVPDSFRKGQLEDDFAAVICRHVLEHIPQPMAFVRDIREALGKRSCVLYFEVPNGEWIVNECSIWDLIYEHVTYWTVPALDILFRRAGLRPLDIRSAYGGQFLSVEAVPATPEPEYLPPASVRREKLELQDGMRLRAAEKLALWAQRISDFTNNGRQVVLWGAGSKGITFANALHASESCLAAMTDLNTRKHGRFIPGAALPVVAPEMLRTMPISDVLVSNALYIEEIREQLAEIGVIANVTAI